MEQKTIPFNKGIVRNTSLATDGELIECVNLMVRDGQMMNAPKEQKTIEVPEGYTLLYIHPLSPDDRYIYSYNDSITDGTNTIYTLTEGEELYEVKHIGNVLVILTSKRTYYALYKDNSYTDYSFDFDNIDIAFGLEGTVVETESNSSVRIVSAKSFDDSVFESVKTVSLTSKDYVDFDSITPNTTYKIKVTQTTAGTVQYYRVYAKVENEYKQVSGSQVKVTNEAVFDTPANTTAIQVKLTSSSYNYSVTLYKQTDQSYTQTIDVSDENNINIVLGEVNKFIKEKCVDDDKFMHPFFVRYAIELIDGSLIKPSAPCLMIPSTGIVPYPCIYRDLSGYNSETTSRFFINSFIASLKYKVLSDISTLKSRSELVRGISFAVTSPIYRYNQGANTTDIKKALYLKDYSSIENDFSIAKIADQDSGKFGQIYKLGLDNISGRSEPSHIINLPQHDDISKQVENASVFRVVCTIPLDKLIQTDDFKNLPIEKGALRGLDGRQILDDNISSLDKYIPQTSFVYNHRLNIANYTEQRFKGYKPTISNGWVDNTREEMWYHQCKTSLSVNMTNHTSVVIDNYDSEAHLAWIFYPSTTAKKITLYRRLAPSEGTIADSNSTFHIKELPLKPHPYLNGAYWFSGFLTPFTSDNKVLKKDFPILSDTSPSIDQPNKIKTSEVNNPFVMVQTTTLNDRVEALATGTKAVSEGQFGQFPLYAFCDDGIWALEPSSDGTYASKQPVSRDVCSNPRGITQTDNAVIYTTRQGLKMLQGSTVTNISKKMEGKAEDTDAFFKDLAEDYNTLIKADTKDFNEVIQEATMCYDYENNLLHIYTQGFTFQLNLETGDYTRTDTPKPTAIVPGYPHATLQIDRALYQYKKPNPQGERKGILLTRETAFDDPLTMKVITDLRVMRRHGDAKVAVYASNDRENWVRMRSLRMASYKWYRFAVFTNLTNTDVLEGIVTRVETRRTNKMR